MSRAKGMVVSSWLRQFHRWVSIAFTATVIAVLLLTGLYLFALPYTVKRRIRSGA